MNKEDIDKLIFGIGVNSYNRFQTFLDNKSKFKEKYYWYALKTAYSNSDNLFRYKNEIKEAFNSNEVDRTSLMEKQELKYFNRLSNKITIYRGMTLLELESEEFGVSWSLKEDIASFFAYTYQRNMSTNHHKKVVCKKIVDKEKIIAFFNDREEFEVIYL